MSTYKYDLHVHSDETSPCGKVKAADVVKMYKKAGYSGIVITDHYFDGFFEDLADMSWKEKVECYLEGYRNAYAEGLKSGLKVILGMELRFDENFNDYLVYGIDEQFLLEYPELYRLDLQSFRELIEGSEILIYQAHPFRSEVVAADPELLDGIEVYNGNPRHNSMNDRAAEYASEHGLLEISGSDFHQVQDLARGGVLFSELIETSDQLVAALKSQKIEGLICT